MISKPKKEYMAKEILVQKASGITEPFSIEKLRYSLSKSKASQEEVNSIIDALLPRLYQGISTNKVLPVIRLKNLSVKYLNIRDTLLKLG